MEVWRVGGVYIVPLNIFRHGDSILNNIPSDWIVFPFFFLFQVCYGLIRAMAQLQYK
jgi:hypothetical protein